MTAVAQADDTAAPCAESAQADFANSQGGFKPRPTVTDVPTSRSQLEPRIALNEPLLE
jgi:hypothetical protein